MDPDVHDTRVVLCLTHGVGDAAAALCVLDPELADSGIRIGKAQIPALRMAERSGVEVKFEIIGLSPLDPALEVLDTHLVAVHEFASEIPVDLMEVDTVVTGEESLDELQVSADLVNVAGASGIVSGGLDTSGKAGVALESHHVVCLPAMKGNLLLLKLLDSLVSVDTDGGVALLGHLVGLDDFLLVHILGY